MFNLVVDEESMSKLSQFLLAEFKKRRDDDLFFSVREWAREIGIPNATLNRYLNSNGKVSISRDNLLALVNYFGKPFLDALGIEIPDKPKNPKH